MTIFLYLVVGLSLFYIYIVFRYLEAWKALPYWFIPVDFQAVTKVSILIPARNEAANIVACLHSICQQNYPTSLFELLVIDDHSTDNTAEIVKKYYLKTKSNWKNTSSFYESPPQLQLLHLADYLQAKSSQSFKKKAIEMGIAHAKGELIVTTDADCKVPKNWLNYIVSFYEKKRTQFIAAPVCFYEENSLLERFQSLDFMGMMGVTGAGIHRRFMNMCNGANLAYPKKVFYEVNGFEGIDQLASGDDMLLMQKIAQKYPQAIGFVKNKAATVFTKAKPTWPSFFQQRIRWASKSRAYKEWRVSFILAMVFFFCCSIIFSAVMIAFWGIKAMMLLLFQLIIKGIMDYLFLKKMALFFNRKDLMKSFLASFFLHIFYIFAIGILGNVIKKYKWKGRLTR